ncbi:MAG TPA: peptidase, partial [Deltaproteobacteria bacterium]|nr:peptidase [Deltaproteobacteria bacterium]
MKTSALLTLSSLFLLLAGCGDSGSTSAPQASAPSPAAPAAAPAAKAGYQAMAT